MTKRKPTAPAAAHPDPAAAAQWPALREALAAGLPLDETPEDLPAHPAVLLDHRRLESLARDLARALEDYALARIILGDLQDIAQNLIGYILQPPTQGQDPAP